eukprot:gene35641-43228_t
MKMTTLTCAHAHCTCSICIEGSLAPKMVEGNCGNCENPVNLHPRQETQQIDQLIGQAVATATAADSTSDSLFHWLASRSGESPLSDNEQVIFWTRFGVYAIPLKEKILSVSDARRLVRQIRTVLRSLTAASMRTQGYVFVGILGQAGAGRALLYQIIDANAGLVKCAKVYCVDRLNETSIATERSASDRIHRDGVVDSIVCYDACLEFSHETAPDKRLVALVMPLFQMTLSTIIDAFQDNPISLVLYRSLVKCLVTAAARLHSLGLVHCDIKPDNVMILDGRFYLIDLGAVRTCGQEVVEFTRGYSMGASHTCVTSQFDMFCISNTLSRCCGYDVSPNNNLERLHRWISFNESKLAGYLEPIRICVNEQNGERALQCLGCFV